MRCGTAQTRRPLTDHLQARTELRLESLELSGYLLQGLVPVFQFLAGCESLRSIVFTDARPGVKPEWEKLSMPFVQSLTVHMACGTWVSSLFNPDAAPS